MAKITKGTLCGQEIKVLDHGFVRLVDAMGDDHRIVQAARVSYGAGSKGDDKDKALIAYLMRKGHTSPFEQVVFTFHCMLPIFVARQWVRHRTARLNEISARYSVLPDKFYIPSVNRICVQSKTNKQGSGDPLTERDACIVRQAIMDHSQRAYGVYKGMVADYGVANEIARVVLPVNIYTEWYWQIDLHNLFHFLDKRLPTDAQWEIQQYAHAMEAFMSALCPWAFEAYTNLRRPPVEFNPLESYLEDTEK
jgi:thymidylate synthase (FAD)